MMLFRRVCLAGHVYHVAEAVAKRLFNFTFRLLALCLTWGIACEVAMSIWKIGADDVSEETQAFKDKIASKGNVGCSPKVHIVIYTIYR